MPNNLLQINPVAIQPQGLTDGAVLQNATTLGLQSPATGGILDPVTKAILGYQQAQAQKRAAADAKQASADAKALEQQRYNTRRSDREAAVALEQERYNAEQERQAKLDKANELKLKLEQEKANNVADATLKARRFMFKRAGVSYDKSDPTLGLIDNGTFKQILDLSKRVGKKTSFHTTVDDKGNVTAITMADDGSFISKNLGPIGQSKVNTTPVPDAPTKQDQAYVQALIAQNPDASAAKVDSHLFSPDSLDNNQNSLHAMKIAYTAHAYMAKHPGVGFGQAVNLVKPALDKIEAERVASQNK